MSIQRRDFIKVTAAGLAALTVGRAKANDTENYLTNANPYGVLVDTAVCVGCRKCELACDKANTHSGRPQSSFDDKSVFTKHRRPADNAFTVVNTFKDPRHVDKNYFMKVQCMHCLQPACASACIVGALRKDERGPVTYDAWKCIGCRYCMVACPFQIPAYEYDNALNPRVRKCTFCFERVTAEGKRPACVEICPNEALTFGTREELIETAHERIKQSPDLYVDHVYGEHEAGGTSWIYLAPAEFKHTELPALTASVIPDLTESIQHGIFKGFVPPLLLAGLLGLAMHSLKDKDESREEVTRHER